MKKRILAGIEQLERMDNLRRLSIPSPSHLSLSTNDYMGISQNQQLYKDFIEQNSIDGTSMGSCSSRLLTGNTEAMELLERDLKDLYQREAALLFNSGYHANIGILPAITTKRDLIIADQYVHASIIDGIQLSKAKSWRFRHQNYDQLEDYLIKYRNDYDQVILVVESLYSMDGDYADLHRLVELKNRYDCLLYVDEAHTFGGVGKRGLGLGEQLGLIKSIDFIVGTFGKAVASQGAFLVCDDIYRTWLIQKSRSLIYTTSLPEITSLWNRHVIHYLTQQEEARDRLAALASWFSRELGIEHQSYIIPYIVGSNKRAIALSNFLETRNISCLPIRYPTVPQETARLRFSLTAEMKMEQLVSIIEAIDTFNLNMVP
ncbi:8-amino-7-oxononanoate synthase [Halosquirtibacter xylanolyticus]|uniref:aminotransferase class I/II-fold pyridoxal phosphate-dependent enzyme n=1 Tax=Halosquirtibacter xylanolyticus TaxID=3374599 RepID=UPI003747E0A5|nr:8-amino-7-oxononanoate synthase [Prolixibacteraceae bacterium]